MSDGRGTKFGGDVPGSSSSEILAAQIAGNNQLAQENPGRFQLGKAQKDQVDLLVAIYVAYANNKIAKAKKAFAALELSLRDIQEWSDEKRARAAYFATLLAKRGFSFREGIEVALNWPIRDLSRGAESWEYLKNKELGNPPKEMQGVLCGMDGCSFILRKLGMDRSMKPGMIRATTQISPEFDSWVNVP